MDTGQTDPIAFHYGPHSDTVSDVATSRTLDLLRRAAQKVDRLEGELDEARAALTQRVKDAHAAGHSWQEMQDAGGMSPNTVQQHLRRAGVLTVRPRR